MGRCRAPLTAVFRRPYEGQYNHLSAFDVLASWGEVACPRSLQTAIAVLRIKPRSPESMPVATAFRKYHNCIMLRLLEIASPPEQHHCFHLHGRKMPSWHWLSSWGQRDVHYHCIMAYKIWVPTCICVFLKNIYLCMPKSLGKDCTCRNLHL